MESSSELMVPILDALSNLNLQSDMLVCMSSVILNREAVVHEQKVATGASICPISTVRT
jgi:hypothetical protein